MTDEKNLSRRSFLRRSAAVGLGMVGASGLAVASHAKPKPVNEPRLPREVWIASVSLEGLEARTPEEMSSRVIKRMEETAPYQPDIVCLPEIFPFINTAERPSLSECAEVPPGPISTPFVEYAKRHRCYIICPIYTREKNRIYNAAVVINREGIVIGEYRKTRPTVSEIEQGVNPGPVRSPVFETDFGRIGVQICFDVNWREGWQHLQQSGAEIIFWPSAFIGGRMLNAYAWIHQCYIVTSTRPDPTRIIDITGDDLAVSGRFKHWVCAPVNLEKAFVHLWPYVQSFDALRAKYGRQLEVTIYGHEEWATIESFSPDLRVSDVLQEFGIATHKEHISRAQKMQEQYYK